ncbi:protein EVI2B [Varanus komodoensis]|uniref:protein EVI2B n=1 Tax=Varanus komodoensis TaxID=61221 RepID=UPI001CF7E765|nr:protein EVI2B [Varanus komodoensis]
MNRAKAMDTHPIILILFCGQLRGSFASAKSTGSANATSPTESPVPITAVFSSSARFHQTSQPENPTKNGRQTPTTKPRLPAGEEPESFDAHVIVAVLIGIILIFMIIVIVGIFLWRRWKKAAAPLPHWAGRSPFADGDIPDVSAEKDAVPGAKRMSVLSLLPWKFHRDTLLMENAEGQLAESGENLDTTPKPSAEGTEKGSNPATTDNSVSSTSTQVAASEGLSGLVHVPLQSDDLDPPEPPPPPTWLAGELNGDPSLNHTESLSPESATEIQCAPSLDLSHQNPLQLPPPPEDLMQPI